MNNIKSIMLTQAVFCALFFSSTHQLLGRGYKHHFLGKSNKNKQTHHRTSSFQKFSSVNGKSEQVNITYSSDVTLSNDNGVKEYLKSQLDLKSMSDKKEILIESLQGKNDFPAHLNVGANSEDIKLNNVILNINGPSVTVSFAIGDDGSAYRLEYDVNEHKFDQALKKMKTIDREEQINQFKDKVKNMPAHNDESFEKIQKQMQEQMSQMRKQMETMMQKMNSMFDTNFSW